MTATRTRISDRTLLASCLARLFGIPHEHQKLMHEDQMISLAERDHWPVPVAEGGTNHFSNVWAHFIAAHGIKTRTIDVPGIAKRKRVNAAFAEHQAVMAAKLTNAPVTRRPKRKIVQRANPWPPKGSRPFQRRAP